MSMDGPYDLLDDPRKYEVGRVLRFVGYNPAEIKDTLFTTGQLVRVVPNADIGILVTPLDSDVVGMVWPEEVLADLTLVPV